MPEAVCRALVTGAGGFVGPYLARHLRDLGSDVWGTTRTGAAHPDFEAVALDVRDADAVRDAMRRVRPDEVYHLAAVSQTHLPDVRAYYATHLDGTLNVLEAAADIGASVVLVSTAYVYAGRAGAIPEDAPLHPSNAYGASKAAAELACLPFAHDGLHVVRVRPFNHTGPGQRPAFFVPALVAQLAAIRDGRAEPVLRLGNLDAVRDLTDVRDVVRAYALALRQGVSGEVYNVASGVGTQMRAVVDLAMGLVDAEVEVATDPARMRASDVPFLIGDATRLRSATGWAPAIPLDATLRDMLEGARIAPQP